MPIAISDVKLRYAVAGGPGNSLPGTALGSLGGFLSLTEVPDNRINNAFDDVTGVENQAGRVEYRCLFVANTHPTEALLSIVAWLASEVASGATLAIGIDPAAASALGSASPQAAVIASETSAPAGVTFSAPSTEETALVLGTLGPGQCRAIWLRRTAANTPPTPYDGGILRLKGSLV